MKTIFYFFLFLLSLLSTTWGLFVIGGFYLPETASFMPLFILTFLSLGGSILFGYAFFHALKDE